MSESKHTPGPWKACPPRFGQQFVRQDPVDWDGHGYQHICTLPQNPKGTHYGEMFEANARLIAAAPDLLAALQAILHPDNEVIVYFVPSDSWATKLRDDALAAIARATGATS